MAFSVFSILPDHLSVIELWAFRIFFVLGFLALSPWILAISYDVILYTYRSVLYEIPILGGRAQGEARPRAPSLSDSLDALPAQLGKSVRQKSRPATPDPGSEPP